MSFIQKFTKRDLGFAILTGLLTGIIAWRVLVHLQVGEIITWSLLPVIVPVVWILGVMLGYFLGQRIFFFNQFGKFAAIGFTNAAVDLGILNSLIFLTGIVEGLGYTIFKTISFIGATLLSYIWNKYWAFNAAESGGGALEFFKFISVAVFSLLVNVAVSSALVNLVDPLFGTTIKQWANVGAIAGSAAALIFSFIGFKLAVFKK